MPDIDPILAIGSLLLILGLQFSVARRHIGSILDPLVYFVVTTSFALTLAVTYVEDLTLVLRVVVYFLSFWGGFHLVMNAGVGTVQAPEDATLTRDRFFPLLMGIGVALFIAMNLLAWASSGIPVLSKDPSLQKVEALTGGLGFVRRYNWGLGIFLFIGSIYWFLFERSRVALICFLIVAGVTILGGSKSAFLPVLFSMGLYVAKPFRTIDGIFLDDLVRRSSKYLIPLAIVPVLVVFVLESDDVYAAGTALVVRLLYFGDVMLFWNREDLRSHFMAATSSLDYFHHIFGAILGALRIVPYELSFGSQFVQFSLASGEDVSNLLGPNTPFYVKGEIFFGVWFAAVYCACVGAIVAFFRRAFMRQRGRTLMSYTTAATLLALSMTLPTEDTLFMGRLGDFFLFFAPVYAMAKLLWWGSRLPRAA